MNLKDKKGIVAIVIFALIIVGAIVGYNLSQDDVVGEKKEESIIATEPEKKNNEEEEETEDAFAENQDLEEAEDEGKQEENQRENQGTKDTSSSKKKDKPSKDSKKKDGITLLNEGGKVEEDLHLSSSDKTYGTKEEAKAKRSVVEGDVYIEGNNIHLQNTKVLGTIFVDPGMDGNAYLENIWAENIKVLSGGENSIYFEGLESENLDIDSTSKVRVVTDKNTKIVSTQVNSDSILYNVENEDGSFGVVEVNNTGEVTFSGKFTDEIIAKRGVSLKATENTIVEKVVLETEKEEDEVKFFGAFSNIEVKKPSRIVLDEKAEIKAIVAKSAVKIQSTATTKVDSVVIETEKEEDQVELSGSFTDVQVKKPVKLKLDKTSKVVTLKTEAKTQIEVDKEAEVEEFDNQNQETEFNEIADKTLLEKALNLGKQVCKESKEGDLEGQYPVGSKKTLMNGIEEGEKVFNNSLANQKRVDELTNKINEAIKVFKGKKITAKEAAIIAAVQAIEGLSNKEYPLKAKDVGAVEKAIMKAAQVGAQERDISNLDKFMEIMNELEDVQAEAKGVGYELFVEDASTINTTSQVIYAKVYKDGLPYSIDSQQLVIEMKKDRWDMGPEGQREVYVGDIENTLGIGQYIIELYKDKKLQNHVDTAGLFISPMAHITSHENGVEVDNGNIVIEGFISNYNKNQENSIVITINGREVSNEGLEIKENGEFTIPITLSEPNNFVLAEYAFKYPQTEGNNAVGVDILYDLYSKEPRIEIISHQDGELVESDEIILEGYIKNVGEIEKENLEILLFGQDVSELDFNITKEGHFTVPVKLKEKNTSIYVGYNYNEGKDHITEEVNIICPSLPIGVYFEGHEVFDGYEIFFSVEDESLPTVLYGQLFNEETSESQVLRFDYLSDRQIYAGISEEGFSEGEYSVKLYEDQEHKKEVAFGDLWMEDLPEDQLRIYVTSPERGFKTKEQEIIIKGFIKNYDMNQEKDFIVKVNGKRVETSELVLEADGRYTMPVELTQHENDIEIEYRHYTDNEDTYSTYTDVKVICTSIDNILDIGKSSTSKGNDLEIAGWDVQFDIDESTQVIYGKLLKDSKPYPEENSQLELEFVKFNRLGDEYDGIDAISFIASISNEQELSIGDYEVELYLDEQYTQRIGIGKFTNTPMVHITSPTANTWVDGESVFIEGYISNYNPEDLDYSLSLYVYHPMIDNTAEKLGNVEFNLKSDGTITVQAPLKNRQNEIKVELEFSTESEEGSIANDIIWVNSNTIIDKIKIDTNMDTWSFWELNYDSQLYGQIYKDDQPYPSDMNQIQLTLESAGYWWEYMYESEVSDLTLPTGEYEVRIFEDEDCTEQIAVGYVQIGAQFLEGYPKVETKTDNAVEISAQTKGEGQVHFVRVSAEEAEKITNITAQEIKDWDSEIIDNYDINDSHAYHMDLFEEEPIIVKFDRLAGSTEYIVYVVAEDTMGNLSEVETISVTTQEDTTTPEFVNGYPRVEEITSTTAKLMVQATEPIRTHFVLFTAEDAATLGRDLEADEIMNWSEKKDEDHGVSYVDMGSIGFVGYEEPESYKFENLESNRDYKLFCVTEDQSGNQTEVKTIDFITE